jgi:hypothetical protein
MSTTCDESSRVSSACRLLPVFMVKARGPVVVRTGGNRKQTSTTAQLGGGHMHCRNSKQVRMQHGGATASWQAPSLCARWLALPPHAPGSKQMAAPASLAVCTADLTRSSGSSSNTNPLVNTAAVDCSACTHAHKQQVQHRGGWGWVRAA